MDWKTYLKNEEEVMAGLRGLAKSTPALPEGVQRAIGEAPGEGRLVVELSGDLARVMVAGGDRPIMFMYLGQSYGEEEAAKILNRRGFTLPDLVGVLGEAGIALQSHYPSNTVKAVRHEGTYERTYEAVPTSRLQVDVDGAYLRVGVPGAAKYILSFIAGNDYLAESVETTLSRLGGGATMADLERAMSDKGYGTVLDPVLDRVKFIKPDKRDGDGDFAVKGGCLTITGPRGNVSLPVDMAFSAETMTDSSASTGLVVPQIEKQVTKMGYALIWHPSPATYIIKEKS